MQDSTLSREPSVPPAGGSGDAPAPPAASSMVMKGPSLMKMLDAVEAPDYSSQPAKDLKKPIHAAITELDEEISTAHEQIADQARSRGPSHTRSLSPSPSLARSHARARRRALSRPLRRRDASLRLGAHRRRLSCDHHDEGVSHP